MGSNVLLIKGNYTFKVNSKGLAVSVNDVLKGNSDTKL